MRTALLFQDGNFVGREYYMRLSAAGLVPDVVAAVGRMRPESREREVERTGGLWNPPEIPAACVRRFESLKDGKLWELLRAEKVDLALQGGVGILTGDMLAVPRFGFLNVHPGRLPGYRGNMCPERAVLNGDAVFATAHLIDEGIDTGPVVAEREYVFQPKDGYAAFRAGMYAHCAAVLAEAVVRLRASSNPRSVAIEQSASGARYWPPLSDEEFRRMRAKFGK